MWKGKADTRTPISRTGARHSFITEMEVFTLEADYLCETGYPFDNSRQIIWKWNGFNLEWTIHLTLSVNFDGQFEDGLYISDSHPPPPPPRPFPLRKNRRRVVCGREGDCTQHSARLMRFGSRGPSKFFFSDTPPKCLDRDCVGRSRTGTRHGNVYRSVRQKQEIVVYQ